MGFDRAEGKIGGSPLRQDIAQRTIYHAGRNGGLRRRREGTIVFDAELGPPIDENVLVHPCPGLSGMLHQHDPVGHQGFVSDTGIRPGKVDDADVQKPVGQLIDRHIRKTAFYPQCNLRPTFPHPFDPRDDDRIPEIGGRRQAQQVLISVRHRDVLAGLMPGAGDRRCMRQELPSCLSQRHTIAITHEKPPAELLFQTTNPRTDRRLGKIELVGSNREAAVNGNFEKASQVFGVHDEPIENSDGGYQEKSLFDKA